MTKLSIELSKGIKLALRPGITAKQVIDSLAQSEEDGSGEAGGGNNLITGYYIAGKDQPKVYLSVPGNPIQTAKKTEKNEIQFDIFEKGKIVDANQNYTFTIKKSELTKIANNVIKGGAALTTDLLEYDKNYLEDLNRQSLCSLKTATASGWAGDFVWAALSFPIELGVKLANQTPHITAMSATSLGITIAFPFILGPLSDTPTIIHKLQIMKLNMV